MYKRPKYCFKASKIYYKVNSNKSWSSGNLLVFFPILQETFPPPQWMHLGRRYCFHPPPLSTFFFLFSLLVRWSSSLSSLSPSLFIGFLSRPLCSPPQKHRSLPSLHPPASLRRSQPPVLTWVLDSKLSKPICHSLRILFTGMPPHRSLSSATPLSVVPSVAPPGPHAPHPDDYLYRRNYCLRVFCGVCVFACFFCIVGCVA